MATSSSTGNSSAGPGTPQDESRQPVATAGDLVKCREDGELDWDTLGNVLTASVQGETLCISYADFKHGRMTRGNEVDIDWKFAYEEKGVIVFRKFTMPPQGKTQNNGVCFAGRGVLKFPVSQVASVLINTKNNTNWNKFLIEIKELKVLSETERSKKSLVYIVHENTRCLVKSRRDFFTFVNTTHTDDGRFVQSGLSIDHPCCPLVKGTVRGKICIGSGWHLEPYEGNPEKTLATYIANVDLCAPLPSSMVSRLLQSQPLAIYYLKKFLKSLNAVPRGLSPHCLTRAKVELDLETSLTSTVQGPDSFLFVGGQCSSLYREQMAVDHFIGTNKPKRPETLIEEEESPSTE